MSYIDTVRGIFEDIRKELEKDPNAFRSLLIHLTNGEEIILRVDRKESFRLRGNYLILLHYDVSEKTGEAKRLIWRIPLNNIEYVIQIDMKDVVSLEELYPEIYEKVES